LQSGKSDFPYNRTLLVLAAGHGRDLTPCQVLGALWLFRLAPDETRPKFSCGLDPSVLADQVVVMSTFIRHVPDGDNRERNVCADCGYVAYENPKVVVGSVVVADGCVLMCRRAIEPRKGFWTLPAGFMELGETLEEGAAREALEEAEAVITIEGILGVFSIARIGQVQVIFRARFSGDGPPTYGAGPESLDVRLFAPDQIHWNEIAFPSVHWALNAWREAGSGPIGKPAGNPPDDTRGVHRMPQSSTSTSTLEESAP
jgi:ADP-ribose pyrophosphatase YjhB (NUDIX family)